MKEQEVVRFIKGELKEELSKDFCEKPFRIFREQDLHACTYYHLRKYFGLDSSWLILNEPQVEGLKKNGKYRFPDIVLLKDGVSKFIIELKHKSGTSGAGKKDQSVLKRSVKGKKYAKKAFLIQTIVDEKKQTRRGVIKYRNAVILIKMNPSSLDEYKKAYAIQHSLEPRSKQMRRKKK